MRHAVVVLAVACGAAPLSAQSRPADEAAIRAHAVVIENALNKRDAAALVALFTPDGNEINGDGPRVAGREAMRQTEAIALAKWPSTLRFTLRDRHSVRRARRRDRGDVGSVQRGPRAGQSRDMGGGRSARQQVVDRGAEGLPASTRGVVTGRGSA